LGEAAELLGILESRPVQQPDWVRQSIGALGGAIVHQHFGGHVHVPIDNDPHYDKVVALEGPHVQWRSRSRRWTEVTHCRQQAPIDYQQKKDMIDILAKATEEIRLLKGTP